MANAFGLAAGAGLLEGYAPTDFIEQNAQKLGLKQESGNELLSREVNFAQALAGGHVPVAAIAVDLMDSQSTREHTAGRTKLEELLHAI